MLNEQNIISWVEASDSDEQKEYRQAVHTVLLAIGSSPLASTMIMKGGMLLALHYGSSRYTKDIDFSTNHRKPDKAQVEEQLNKALSLTVEQLDYGLDCKVQSIRRLPKRQDTSFPALKIKVGYAYKGTNKHRNKFKSGQSTTVVEIDYSFNEIVPNVEPFTIGDGTTIYANRLEDIIAEKFRAIVQQPERNRFRRQDIYDLHFLLENYGNEIRQLESKILSSLLEKSQSRGIEVTQLSLDEPEIIKRSEANYQSLASEIEGKLPDFNFIYEKVSKFYRSLPWDSLPTN